MKIRVLNNNYNIKKVKNLSDERIGECSFNKKQILYCDKIDNEETSEIMKLKTLTHELAHAFMYETGQHTINNEEHAELLGMFSIFIINNLDKINKIIKN